MSVITIRGQFGSRTRETGRLIAHKLNIDYMDRELVAEVAERFHWSSQSIADKERPPSTFLGRLEEALGHVASDYKMYPSMYLHTLTVPPDDTQYLTGLESVIRDIAESKSIVIRGRGSQFILKDFPGAFHVMVVAPLEVRIARIMADMNIDAKEAQRRIDRFDNASHEFLKRYYHARVEDPVHYDLVINTEHLDPEAAASIVVNALPLKDKKTEAP